EFELVPTIAAGFDPDLILGRLLEFPLPAIDALDRSDNLTTRCQFSLDKCCGQRFGGLWIVECGHRHDDCFAGARIIVGKSHERRSIKRNDEHLYKKIQHPLKPAE